MLSPIVPASMPATTVQGFPLQELEQLERTIAATQDCVAALQLRRELLTNELERITRPALPSLKIIGPGVLYRGEMVRAFSAINIHAALLQRLLTDFPERREAMASAMGARGYSRAYVARSTAQLFSGKSAAWVAIRRALGCRVIGDVAAGADLVFDHHGLAQARRQFGGDAASDHVSGRSGGKGNQEAHGPGRIVLRRGDRAAQQQAGSKKHPASCITPQAGLVGISCRSVCYLPRPMSDANFALMQGMGIAALAQQTGTCKRAPRDNIFTE